MLFIEILINRYDIVFFVSPYNEEFYNIPYYLLLETYFSNVNKSKMRLKNVLHRYIYS